MVDLKNQKKPLRNVKTTAKLSLLLFIFINSCQSFKNQAQAPMLIPKRVHQIWIGSNEIPEFISIYRESFSRNMPEFLYRLWTNTDITRENFPLTYDYILKSVHAGIDLYGENPKLWMNVPAKKLAQIADLMRYEIIYHQGGCYFDAKFEILKKIGALIDKKSRFVVANESPCKLSCQIQGKYYLSNAFFCASQHHEFLEQLLSPESLKTIQFTETDVNVQTGPFFFRSKIDPDSLNLQVLETNEIYPFIDWKDPYRIPEQDKCISDSPIDENTSRGHVIFHKKKRLFLSYPCMHYPQSSAVDHVSLGKTW